MGREGCTSETYYAVHLDLIENLLVVFWNCGHDVFRKIDSFSPLVSFNINLDMNHIVACKVFARTYRLYGSGNRRVYIC